MGRFKHFEIGGADEEDVPFLSAMESSHSMHIEEHALTFGGEVEVLQYGFDDKSAADWATYGLADHGSNSRVNANSTPVLKPLQYSQMIAIAIAS